MGDWTAEAFAPVEARNRAIVECQTWGHLAPDPRRKYQGTILAARGEYGDIIPIKVDFADLPDSPWFYDALIEFIWSWEMGAGCIRLFSGTYMQFKNGGHRFSGECRDIESATEEADK